MLSVWHKADIYRIPIYAPVTRQVVGWNTTDAASWCLLLTYKKRQQPELLPPISVESLVT